MSNSSEDNSIHACSFFVLGNFNIGTEDQKFLRVNCDDPNVSAASQFIQMFFMTVCIM